MQKFRLPILLSIYSVLLVLTTQHSWVHYLLILDIGSMWLLVNVVRKSVVYRPGNLFPVALALGTNATVCMLPDTWMSLISVVLIIHRIITQVSLWLLLSNKQILEFTEFVVSQEDK
jgi:hypothetical protein